MARNILDEDRTHPAIRQKISDNHRDLMEDVIGVVDKEAVVVIGMRQNPLCRRACKTLEEHGIAYTYLEYGSYLSEWRRRNALKMWTGWPTFPMVFVKRQLIGGAEDLKALLEKGELERS